MRLDLCKWAKWNGYDNMDKITWTKECRQIIACSIMGDEKNKQEPNNLNAIPRTEYM